MPEMRTTLEMILRREANKSVPVHMRALFLRDDHGWTPTDDVDDSPALDDFMFKRVALNERPAHIGLVDSGVGPDGRAVWRNTNTMKMLGTMRGKSQNLALALRGGDGTYRVLWAGRLPTGIMFDAWAETKIPSGALELVLAEDDSDYIAVPEPILTDAKPLPLTEVLAETSGMSHLASWKPPLGTPLYGFDSYPVPPNFKINWDNDPHKPQVGDLRQHEVVDPRQYKISVFDGDDWVEFETINWIALHADDAPRLRRQIANRAAKVLRQRWDEGKMPGSRPATPATPLIDMRTTAI